MSNKILRVQVSAEALGDALQGFIHAAKAALAAFARWPASWAGTT